MLEINKSGTVLLTGEKNNIKILLGSPNPNFKSDRKKNTNSDSLHLPAGMIDDKKLDPKLEALRELQEESGGFFICNNLHPDKTEDTSLGKMKINQNNFYCLNKKAISLEMLKPEDKNFFRVNFYFFLYYIKNLESEQIKNTCKLAIEKLDDEKFKHYKEMLDWHEIKLSIFLEKLKEFNTLESPTKQWYYQNNPTSKHDQLIKFEIDNKKYFFNKGYFSALSQVFKQIAAWEMSKELMR